LTFFLSSWMPLINLSLPCQAALPHECYLELNTIFCRVWYTNRTVGVQHRIRLCRPSPGFPGFLCQQLKIYAGTNDRPIYGACYLFQLQYAFTSRGFPSFPAKEGILKSQSLFPEKDKHLDSIFKPLTFFFFSIWKSKSSI
jgi:hypothetical protein